MICTVSCIPTGIYNNVHALFFSSHHVYMAYIPTSLYNYVHYSSDLIICTVSCIPTGIYNNVHALFFSPYHMYHVMYAYWYIQ